jgi:hypothetical protein
LQLNPESLSLLITYRDLRRIEASLSVGCDHYAPEQDFDGPLKRVDYAGRLIASHVFPLLILAQQATPTLPPHS